MGEILELLLDSLLDCLKALPFLLVTFFLMEYIEHRAAEKFINTVRGAGRFGPALGALLGCVPQCGFSAACAGLYGGGLVSAGTLTAVFLATSDEAIPVLLTDPAGWHEILRLILVKVVIAMAAGFLLDAVWSLQKQRVAYEGSKQPHICKSDSRFANILIATLKRTLEIFTYLLLFTVLISLAIHFIGEERLGEILLPGPFQPLLAAVIGLIPNCAASVLITRLYMQGIITFGAAVAGLCSSAGMGMLVLLRGKRKAGHKAVVIGVTFAVAAFSGMLLQLVG